MTARLALGGRQGGAERATTFGSGSPRDVLAGLLGTLAGLERIPPAALDDAAHPYWSSDEAVAVLAPLLAGMP